MEDFDRPAAPRTTPRPERMYTALELEAACVQARAEGQAAGEAANVLANTAGPDPETAALLTRLAEEATVLPQAWRQEVQEAATALAQLLCAAFAVAFPVLCARHGPAELVAVAREVIEAMPHAPDLRVHVAPANIARLENLLAQMHHSDATMRLIPENGMGPADLRLRWRHGAAERSADDLWSRITEILVPQGLLSDPGRTSAAKESEYVI